VRRLLVGIAALAATAAVPQAASALEPSGPVPTAYALDLRYEPRGGGTLSGTETIDFVNRGPDAVDAVWLRLWANGPDRCRPRRIAVTVEPPAVAGIVGCTALEVRLPAPVPAGGTGRLALALRVIERDAPDRFGRTGAAALFGNVIPLLAVQDALGLHLEPYVADGEGFYSLSAPWDATLDIPSGMRAASTGATVAERVSGGGRTISVHTDHARDFALAVGRLRVTRTRVGDILVRVASPRRRGHGRGMLRMAAHALSAYGARFGPYDSPEVDLVELDGDIRSPGMEYPELVFSVPAATVVRHELAHQWWYSIVGNNEYREPWLDESFASYSELLLARDGFFDCDLRRPFSPLPRSRRPLRLDASMRVFARSSLLYGAVVYYAGACVLRSLERNIGHARMREFLRLLVERHRHGIETKAEVLQTLSEVAPRGFDLDRFLARAHLSP
jgi:Peptidase family M1 domain